MDCKECGKELVEAEIGFSKDGRCISCNLIERGPLSIRERPRVEARQSIMYHTKKMYRGG